MTSDTWYRNPSPPKRTVTVCGNHVRPSSPAWRLDRPHRRVLRPAAAPLWPLLVEKWLKVHQAVARCRKLDQTTPQK
jgi:hypothetical protein